MEADVKMQRWRCSRAVSLCLQHYEQCYIRVLGTASNKASALLKIQIGRTHTEKEEKKPSILRLSCCNGLTGEDDERIWRPMWKVLQCKVLVKDNR